MVGIEIGVLAAQCLDRRIESIKQLAAEIAIWEQQRNAVAARVKWMFTTDKARAKRATPIPGLRLTQVTLKARQNYCAAVLDAAARIAARKRSLLVTAESLFWRTDAIFETRGRANP
jgi:hypothetical protein